MKAVTSLNKQDVLIYGLVVCYFHLLGKKTPLQDFFPTAFTFVEGDNTLPSTPSCSPHLVYSNHFKIVTLQFSGVSFDFYSSLKRFN